MTLPWHGWLVVHNDLREYNHISVICLAGIIAAGHMCICITPTVGKYMSQDGPLSIPANRIAHIAQEVRGTYVTGQV
jgi:hypothetical protein